MFAINLSMTLAISSIVGMSFNPLLWDDMLCVCALEWACCFAPSPPVKDQYRMLQFWEPKLVGPPSRRSFRPNPR